MDTFQLLTCWAAMHVCSIHEYICTDDFAQRRQIIDMTPAVTNAPIVLLSIDGHFAAPDLLGSNACLHFE